MSTNCATLRITSGYPRDDLYMRKSQMVFEPGFTGYGKVKAVPLAGGFDYEEGIVGIYLVLEYLAYLRNRETRVDEPNRPEAVNTAAQGFDRLVNLLIVLIVMELIRNEIYGHRDTPSRR